MILTKNLQSTEALARMTAAAFPGRQMRVARELTEGLCNAAYRIALDDGTETIVKIAPARADTLLSNEVGLMAAEVRAMRLVREQTAVPVARVYAYDTSRTLCSSDYFFMEVMPGQSLHTLRDGMSAEALEDIHRQIGRITREIASVRGPRFGFLGDDGLQFDRLYDFVRLLLTNVLGDAARRQVALGVLPEALVQLLARDAPAFDEVTEPRLIHWDMWEGNIFVADGRVSGIIDWERAMWSEPLGDDRFRRHTRTSAFLEGYGQTRFTPAQWRRILWYDVFLYLTMMTEGSYRGYADDSQYRWTRPLFEASLAELQEMA